MYQTIDKYIIDSFFDSSFTSIIFFFFILSKTKTSFFSEFLLLKKKKKNSFRNCAIDIGDAQDGSIHASFMYIVRSLILQCFNSLNALCASLGDAKATLASPVGMPLSLYRRITFSLLTSKSPKNSMISLMSALKGTFSKDSTQPGLPKPSTT